jgi:hypothetical protein
MEFLIEYHSLCLVLIYLLGEKIMYLQRQVNLWINKLFAIEKYSDTMMNLNQNEIIYKHMQIILNLVTTISHDWRLL